MALGTAGLTAGLSIHALEAHGLRPDHGPVLVLGASGGVGSTAVGALAAAGYEVWAATGKPDQGDYLRGLGAHEIVAREETTADSDRPLEKTRWARRSTRSAAPPPPTPCARRATAAPSRSAA